MYLANSLVTILMEKLYYCHIVWICSFLFSTTYTCINLFDRLINLCVRMLFLCNI